MIPDTPPISAAKMVGSIEGGHRQPSPRQERRDKKGATIGAPGGQPWDRSAARTGYRQSSPCRSWIEPMPGRAAEIAVAIAGAVTYGGGSMTEAREVMDQLLDRDNWLTTVGLEDRDLEAAAKLLASDVVAVTPGVGQIEGRERLVDHTRQFMDAFPDLQYESRHKYESGNAAIDVGRYVGTNTGPLRLPSGESIPATGKIVKLRICAIATVEGGLITHYEIYFDQMEMLGQLGLLPDQPDQ